MGSPVGEIPDDHAGGGEVVSVHVTLSKALRRFWHEQSSLWWLKFTNDS